MNKLNSAKRVQVVSALVEGCSINSTVRMTGVAKHTILKLLVDLGRACAKLHDETMRDLPCRRIQCDELWSFCYAKDKNVPASMRNVPGIGSVWTWVAIDADTKLIAGWYVGSRDAACAYEFLQDLAPRLKHRIQLTTDGYRAYLNAVDMTFGNHQIDYATLVKLYGEPTQPETRYSPAPYIGSKIETIAGDPDPEHISTSYIERQNLTVRMENRRFTRLTNGFSKKFANLEHSVALHYTHYNFVRIHKTIRCTPAMEAGVTDRLWSVADLVALLD